MTAQEALQELVEWFNEQNTEASKRYWIQERGWTQEVVDEFLLGWAPPNPDAAYEHLSESGFSDDEILGTGAFTEDLQCLWRGRYTLPYFDSESNVTYAIARCTGDKGGGAVGYDGHECDIMSGKYAKLSHTKDYAEVDEPIWGLQTLPENAEFVVITEGIADAITAAHNDIPVLSPVTVQFKEKHFEPLIDALEAHNTDRVYFVPDSEEVQDTEKHGVAAGVRGSLKMGDYLIENSDLDVELVQLPRDSTAKVDLDSYLIQNSKNEFLGLMMNATDVTEHPAFEAVSASSESSREYDYDPEEVSSDDWSAIYELSITDVLPSNSSRRGPNPLGHHGDSENYFVVLDDDVAYDQKYKVTYNALTYILCKIGERDQSQPQGDLSEGEVWSVWAHCKDEGIIAEDDSVPVRAMRHIADELGHSPPVDDPMPVAMYNDVLADIEDRGLDHGREQIHSTPVEEYSESASPYFKYDCATVVNLCEAAHNLTNIEVSEDDQMWTSDEVQHRIPALALIALEEGLVSVEELNRNWYYALSDEAFLRVCIIAREQYLFSGRPPARCYQYLAEEFGLVDSDGDIDSHSEGVIETIYNEYEL